MNTKTNEVSMFASQLSKVANDLSQRGEELAEHVLKSKKQAEKNLHRWEIGMREIVKRHPGKTLLGALVMGFILAKVSRYV